MLNVYISVSVLLVSSASSSSFCCQPPPCPRHLQCPHLSELLTGSSPYDSLASSFLGSYHLSKQRDSLKEIRQNSNSGSKNRENQNNDTFRKKWLKSPLSCQYFKHIITLARNQSYAFLNLKILPGLAAEEAAMFYFTPC